MAYTIHDSCSSGCTKVSRNTVGQCEAGGEQSGEVHHSCRYSLCGCSLSFSLSCLQDYCKNMYAPCRIEGSPIDVIANCVSQQQSSSRQPLLL
jgi:hypothetical protein